jgi:TM2 domain-containing membrane protein YozV
MQTKLSKFLLSRRYVYYMVVSISFSLLSMAFEKFALGQNIEILGFWIRMCVGFPVAFFMYEYAHKKLSAEKSKS